MKNVILWLISSFLFIAACFVLIPPVPSDPSTGIRFTPQGWIAILFFAGSRLIALQLKAERTWTVLLQVLGFALFAWLLFERFQFINME